MGEQIIDILLDEGKWLPAAMFLSALAAVLTVRSPLLLDSTRSARIDAAMNLFYGCMIGIMAGGHLLAVTIKVSRGDVASSLWLLYPIGLALAIPAWWLAVAARSPATDRRDGKRTVALNACLGLLLLALGLHNWPLAAPAALNIAYHLHSRRAVGLTLAAVTATAYLALFVGSLQFLASGQTFEQFMGIE